MFLPPQNKWKLNEIIILLHVGILFPWSPSSPAQLPSAAILTSTAHQDAAKGGFCVCNFLTLALTYLSQPIPGPCSILTSILWSLTHTSLSDFQPYFTRPWVIPLPLTVQIQTSFLTAIGPRFLVHPGQKLKSVKRGGIEVECWEILKDKKWQHLIS